MVRQRGGDRPGLQRAEVSNLQKPYPKIYQPFSFSPETIRWCAHEDIMPIILYTDIEKLKKLYRLYQDEAAVAGPNL